MPKTVFISPASGHRRQLLGLMGAAAFGLLGCQTVPPTTPTPSVAVASKATREAELQRLGFIKTDEGWEFAFSGKILFETASDALDPASQAVADRIGDSLRKIGVDRLRVEGHTDNVGSEPFNLALSQRRAEAVAMALAKQGLALDHMQVKGLGKQRPVADNNTPEGRLQNRRVAVIVPAQ